MMTSEKPLPRIWSLARHLRFGKSTVAIVIFLLLLRSFVLLMIPWPLKLIIDSVIYQKPLVAWLAPILSDPITARGTLLNELGILMLFLGVAENALAYHGDRLLLAAGQQAILNLRSALFAHVEGLSLSFHLRQKIGDLMAKLGGDIQSIQDFVLNVGVGLFAHFLTIFGMAVILLKIDWRYALLVLLTAPVLFVVTQNFSRRARLSLRVARQKESEVWSLVQEILTAIPIVQAYGREGYEQERFRTRASDSLGAALEAGKMQLQLPRLVGSVFAAATAATLWFGAGRVIGGSITAGELLIFLAYLRGMATPIRQLAKNVNSFGKAAVAAERLVELFAETGDVAESRNPVILATCRGELEFRSVYFGYRGEQIILRDISFRIAPGQTAAVVGATGAGKSTIARLILRFHDPSQGDVLLDGASLKDISIASLRAHIALVSQEPILFSGTVWENIAYGQEGTDRQQAINAARAVGVHDLIEQLPCGYDTVVGERGATLSGGQRQCISIARAMLRNAPIVILDEPTASLDAISEHHVAQAIIRLTQGRTTLIIAHRLRTIASADLILVLHGGRIVQTGTHEGLLRCSGRYADLWRRHGDDGVETAQSA